MHHSAYEHGRKFFETYWNQEFHHVVELGSQNVNGSIRDHCPAGATYLGLDMQEAKGVDLVIDPGKPLPLANNSTDVVITSSALEHDAHFWMTFLDLVRVLKPGGLLYINAPSNGAFHRYPVDCWRFYPDAGPALASWSIRSGQPVELVESFVASPDQDIWADYIAIFRKAGGGPLIRNGRMMDLCQATNAHDIASGELLFERQETFEMIRIESLESENRRLREELEEAKSSLASALSAISSSETSSAPPQKSIVSRIKQRVGL